jgi:uncharacterized membrane protein
VNRWLGVAAALAALSWVAAIVAAPLLPVPVAGLLYAAGSLICHQLPERSFYLQSFQLPVCARCFGLYAGGAVGSAAAAAVGFTTLARSAPWRSNRALYVATVMAAIPTVLTVVVERGVGGPVSNTMRAAAAIPLAGVIAYVVVRALAHPADSRPR